jgi:hypothetical protein
VRQRIAEVLREGPATAKDLSPFPGRERTTRPSGCPRCRSRRISLPSLRVE